MFAPNKVLEENSESEREAALSIRLDKVRGTETHSLTTERKRERNSETPKNREKEGKDKGSPQPTENVWPFLPPRSTLHLVL